MNLGTDVLKRLYSDRLVNLHTEISRGHSMMETRERELQNLRDQVLRIEGARMAVEELLNGVVQAEKAAEQAAKDAKEKKNSKTPTEPVEARQ